ncbi:hypothetical protein LSAT2_006035 [Lamellibrachia satsuma]|nr:hypothetical protein LSAT2_006035 [Lamellibrachia satsuma]
MLQVARQHYTVSTSTAFRRSNMVSAVKLVVLILVAALVAQSSARKISGQRWLYPVIKCGDKVIRTFSLICCNGRTYPWRRYACLGNKVYRRIKHHHW